jgi:TetR/AcrR family transcriptional regulator, transcriptional repressor for nem operon
MGRRRAFDTDSVVNAARQLFWERGYELTSIGDLETRTGLDRSSLYNAFGSKQALFEAALRSYLSEAIDTRLHGLRQPDASLDTVIAFFDGMAATFRGDPQRAVFGCLMVNALGEHGADGGATQSELARAYRDSFRQAFRNALGQAAARGEIGLEQVEARSKLLAATVMGLFVSARIDPFDAADVCDSVAAEVAGWTRG